MWRVYDDGVVTWWNSSPEARSVMTNFTTQRPETLVGGKQANIVHTRIVISFFYSQICNMFVQHSTKISGIPVREILHYSYTYLLLLRKQKIAPCFLITKCCYKCLEFHVLRSESVMTKFSTQWPETLVARNQAKIVISFSFYEFAIRKNNIQSKCLVFLWNSLLLIYVHSCLENNSLHTCFPRKYIFSGIPRPEARLRNDTIH